MLYFYMYDYSLTKSLRINYLIPGPLCAITLTNCTIVYSGQTDPPFRSN